MEIRNGVPRLIHQLEHRHDFIFQGSSKMTAAVEASARAAGISLMDLLLQTGLRGVMRTTAWIGEDVYKRQVEGQSIRVVITECNKDTKGAQVLVSRSDAKLVKRLFEKEEMCIRDRRRS